MSAIFSCGGTTITLRNPQLGDTSTMITGISTRTTMDGSVWTWKKTVNPKRLLLNFVELTCGEIENFKTFIKTFAGSVITLRVLGNIYTGYIINTPVEFTRNYQDTFAIEYEVLTESLITSTSPEPEPEPEPEPSLSFSASPNPEPPIE